MGKVTDITKIAAAELNPPKSSDTHKESKPTPNNPFPENYTPDPITEINAKVKEKDVDPQHYYKETASESYPKFLNPKDDAQKAVTSTIHANKNHSDYAKNGDTQTEKVPPTSAPENSVPDKSEQVSPDSYMSAKPELQEVPSSPQIPLITNPWENLPDNSSETKKRLHEIACAPIISQPSPIVPSQSLEENLEIQKALDNNLIKYGAAGAKGANGILQLTQAGHELHRETNKHPLNIKKEEEELTLEPTIEIQTVMPYALVRLEINEDTLILNPVQQHMVVVKGHPEDDGKVDSVGYLTSTSGKKVGIETITGPENPKLSNDKPSGQQQPQYIVPTIPPLTISTDQCKLLETEKLNNYMQRPSIITKLDTIYEQTSKYETEKYSADGITLEDLRDINNLHDAIKKNITIDPSKHEVNLQDEDEV